MYTDALTKTQIDNAFDAAIDHMSKEEKQNSDILQLFYHWFYAGVRFREQFDEATLEENQIEPTQPESKIIHLTTHRVRNKK